MRFSLNFAFWVTCLILAVGCIVLLSESSSIGGALFFIPFSFGPLLVSIALTFYVWSRFSLLVLAVGSSLYGVWFGYVYMSAFHWHIDPQSAIALLFVGIYSLPVMIPVWLIVWAFRGSSPKRSGEQRSGGQPDTV